MSDFQVVEVGKVSQVHAQVVALRADLGALWENVPAFIKPAYNADVSAILGRIDELAEMTKG